MSDPWQPPAEPAPGAQPPAYPSSDYGPPPGWGPPPGYAPPPGYSWPGYGLRYGLPGVVRSTGLCLVLYIVTFGIYGFVYNYRVHSEMKNYSGRGVGGGVALLLTFVANVAMPFVTPAEVGSLYAMRGESPPVRGWTGLWVLLSAVGGYVVLSIAILTGVTISASDSSSSSSTGSAVAFVVLLAVFGGLVIAGAVTWFVKTNGALNRFWLSVGA